MPGGFNTRPYNATEFNGADRIGVLAFAQGDTTCVSAGVALLAGTAGFTQATMTLVSGGTVALAGDIAAYQEQEQWLSAAGGIVVGAEATWEQGAQDFSLITLRRHLLEHVRGTDLTAHTINQPLTPHAAAGSMTRH